MVALVNFKGNRTYREQKSPNRMIEASSVNRRELPYSAIL